MDTKQSNTWLQKSLFSAFVLLSSAQGLLAQNIEIKQPRYVEGYSKTDSDTSGSTHKKIKHIPIGTGKIFISFGGELRYQYFRYKNPGWGTEPQDNDGFVLTRFLSHTDIHLGKQIRVFAQLQSSLIAGSNSQNSPVDENPLDVHQLFIKLPLIAKMQKQLVFEIGRQELSYGSQRLISIREGPNNRQAFDAFRVVFSQKQIRTDLFYSTYVNAGKKIFDERFFDHSRQLWGYYLTLTPTTSVPNMDLYYLGVKNRAMFIDASGTERRHSTGTRIWKKAGITDYDFEAVYQFGNISRLPIRAWTISLNISSKLKSIPFAPVFGLKTELISGDKRPDDHLLNTFNPLYPRGAYFGLASLIGPYNLYDFHPYIQIDIGRKLTWSVDFDFFWRMSRYDGLYAVNGKILSDRVTVGYKHIGNQSGTNLSFHASSLFNLGIEFTWFDSGQFLRQAGMKKDIYLAGLTATLKY